jgi:flagellar protein FlgJ
MPKIQPEFHMLTALIPAPRPAGQTTADAADLRAKAEELETLFLTEMLAHAGLGETGEAFGGGVGEEQFASFLREAQAAAMVKAGGIGLAESLFRAMAGNADG